MSLKYRIKTKAEIPAEHAALYVEKNGEFILDAEGAADADRLAEFRNNNTKLLKLIGADKIEDALAKLETLKDVDPAKYKELVKAFEEAETDKLKNKGEYEKALETVKATMKAEFERQKKILEDANAQLRQRLEVELIDNAVVAAATAKGVRASALVDVKARARGVFKLDGDKIGAFDGTTPKLRTDGEAYQIGDFVESLVKDAAHLFDESKGTGGGVGGGGGGYQGVNPYAAATKNLTLQAQIERTNPTLAKQLQIKAAGANT